MTDICKYPKRDLFIRVNLQCPYKGYYLRWYFNGWHYWHFHPGEQVAVTEGKFYNTHGKKRIAIGTGNISSNQVNVIRTLLLTKEVQIYTEYGWVNVFVNPGTMVIYDNEVNGYEVELIITIGSKEISYLSGYSPVEYVPIVPVPDDTGICEVIIGSQIWMCYNYASAFPGSKVYNNDEGNRDIYGGLYTWDQIMSSGFCPTGWKIPSETEWQTLINYLAGAAAAGGHLKEIGTDHWQTPNTGADNSSGFAARGAGYWNYLFNSFLGLKQNTRFWTSTEKSATNAATALLNFDSAAISLGSSYKGWGFSVRMIKEAAYILKDLDGNIYTTITIGSQQWIVQNFRCTKYANGSAIPNLTLDADWLADITGAYCAYDNNVANIAIYGILYNWYAVNNVNGLAYLQRGGIREDGWRIPSLVDFQTLSAYLGGDAISGGKLKEIGTDYWDTPNTGATNSSGFTALGSGQRDGSGIFYEIKEANHIWTSIDAGASELYYDTDDFWSGIGSDIKNGYSVRLVRDV